MGYARATLSSVSSSIDLRILLIGGKPNLWKPFVCATAGLPVEVKTVYSPGGLDDVFSQSPSFRLIVLDSDLNGDDRARIFARANLLSATDGPLVRGVRYLYCSPDGVIPKDLAGRVNFCFSKPLDESCVRRYLERLLAWERDMGGDIRPRGTIQPFQPRDFPVSTGQAQAFASLHVVPALEGGTTGIRS